MRFPLRWKHPRTTLHLDSWDVDRSQELSTRRYLLDSTYLLPKDEEEGQRLFCQHYALAQALGNHYVAPTQRAMLPGRIADSSTF